MNEPKFQLGENPPYTFPIVKSLRSKFKIKNYQFKISISGEFKLPLIEDHQIKDCGGGLYPKLLNSKNQSLILNFAF